LKPGVNKIEILFFIGEQHAFDLTEKQTPVSVNAARLCKTLKAVVREELGRT